MSGDAGPASAAELDELAVELGRVVAPLRDGAPAVVRNASSAELTTYRTGGSFGVLVRVADDDALFAVRSVLRTIRPRVLILGRGSNVLVADAGFAGIALLLTGDFEEVAIERTHVTAGSAVPLPVLARRAAAAGRAGLEFFVGIPGSVGGAVRMNAGGHGRETAEVLLRAWTLDLLATTPARERHGADLGFAFRHSDLRRDEIVLRAEFSVTPAEPAECEARVAEIVRWRRENQPGGANAGSVFVNPGGDSAGRLIDAAGLKGRRIGAAVVSDKHANFIQAEPGATAADIHDLLREVQRAVKEQFGVTMRPEVQLIGFEDQDRP